MLEITFEPVLLVIHKLEVVCANRSLAREVIRGYEEFINDYSPEPIELIEGIDFEIMDTIVYHDANDVLKDLWGISEI